MARKPKTPAVTPPDLPPLSEQEIALEREITAGLQGLAARLHQRNLDNAVVLAQQAARGRGPLVAHFAELGHRYAGLLDRPQRPALRVVKGESA